LRNFRVFVQQSVKFLSFVPGLEINIGAPDETRFGQNPSQAKTKQNKLIYNCTLQQKGRSSGKYKGFLKCSLVALILNN